MAENQHKSDQSLIGTKSTVERPSVIAIMIHLFHRFVCKMFRFIFLVIYGAHGKSMPSIDDPLLLDSASTLAEKIRTKQVNRHLSLKKISTLNFAFFLGNSNKSDERFH